MRTAVSVIAYAATYGVPLITSSRVPAILPTRPLAGKSIRKAVRPQSKAFSDLIHLRTGPKAL